mmetsp:Transcript_20117/g.34661  ORF Transcript_20117/g.34661 Transcript_20117/m.34661 type:complete len:287 (+) Transcript_20117:73-933(+)
MRWQEAKEKKVFLTSKVRNTHALDHTWIRNDVGVEMIEALDSMSGQHPTSHPIPRSKPPSYQMNGDSQGLLPEDAQRLQTTPYRRCFRCACFLHQCQDANHDDTAVRILVHPRYLRGGAVSAHHVRQHPGRPQINDPSLPNPQLRWMGRGRGRTHHPTRCQNRDDAHGQGRVKLLVLHRMNGDGVGDVSYEPQASPCLALIQNATPDVDVYDDRGHDHDGGPRSLPKPYRHPKQHLPFPDSTRPALMTRSQAPFRGYVPYAFPATHRHHTRSNAAAVAAVVVALFS